MPNPTVQELSKLTLERDALKAEVARLTPPADPPLGGDVSEPAATTAEGAT